MDALTTLRTEINRLGFTPNEQDSLRKYFTENVEKINVVVSFLPDYETDDEKRGYLKSLISTPGISSLHAVSYSPIIYSNSSQKNFFSQFVNQNGSTDNSYNGN